MTGVIVTGPNSPDGFGAQFEASNISFFTFSFFLADIFIL